jgi:hypothetical protein
MGSIEAPEGKGGASNTEVETSWWLQSAGDADGDGWTAAEGDCDDGSADTHPGVALDSCDGIDNNCDGQVDEDGDIDPYEPNDSQATPLGDLSQAAETLVFATLSQPGDEDRFRLQITEYTLEDFDLEVWLYGVPAEADYALELVWVEDASGSRQGRVDQADDNGKGGFEFVEYGGEFGTDDSGTYEIRVTSTIGSDCASPYMLQVLVGGL